MNVIEIFSSIEGEGKRQGELCTFVRLAGCNMRCPYCDSKYSYGENADIKNMSVLNVVRQIKRLGNRNVTITGGEPLLQAKEVEKLIRCMPKIRFNIETNGTISKPFVYPNTFYTADYKMPCSGAIEPINKKLITQLTAKDVLKFVVNDMYELGLMKDFILSHKFLRCLYYVSPVYGKTNLNNIVEFLKKHSLQKVRIQLQIHKIIWSPDKRGV